jgi:mannose-6-phosphate isomerase-like protein (cupin superfamily)
MIHRHSTNGQKLDVAGLNEITVLIDRSETELTEVAMNAWTPALDGPPHAHARKEQNFLVTSGRGTVRIGDQSFAAQPGAYFYIPAGVIHQTITAPGSTLTYFLFNAFLDTDKEGHKSFADHIAKVKETRLAQATAQRADADAELKKAPPPKRPGRFIDTTKLGTGSTAMIARSDAERCESVHHRLTSHGRIEIKADATKEQTFYVVSGTGRFTVGTETVDVGADEVVFVPRRASGTLLAGEGGIQAISFGTVVQR